MKILHIGDIHLGCTLENQKRNAEIEKVFNHLTDYVRQNEIRAALLAGDVFDKGAPSNESQELYYRFLLNLQQAGCRQVIVIAGNHDSSSFLDAPQALLKQMDIHIIGNVSPENPEKEVIELGDKENPEAYVCAVPFLNERDVRILSPEAESGADRDDAVAKGIEKHYRDIFQIADRERNGRNIPIIGMGHLYAAGSTFATADDSRTPVGNLNAVDLNECVNGFSYMALGHLHQPQTVRNHENCCYAGSILPMNLREHQFRPRVVLLDTADLAHPVSHELPAECFHEMKIIRGTMEELRKQLSELDATGREIWVKVVYTDPEIRPNWAIELRQEFRERQLQIVLSEVRRETAKEEPGTAAPETEKTLSAMTPEELFLRHLDKKGEVTDPDQRKTYLELFRESMRKVCDPSEQKETSALPTKRGLMKFERLYIKNVNSLYGENLIDFTAPEFREGIFLISGKTGSGKSSILDAICLALFGSTPRAMSVSKRAAFSNQQDCVMSEGTKEVQAELTFTLSGIRYRACFQHQRTVRSAQNPFAQVKHLLYQNDVQIPGTSGAIKNKIISLIGMDQTQFCRCVLLAQGSFDAFLKAEADERSVILKNITGTEIYSQISRQINADFSEAKSQYDLAKQALAGITLLTAEEQQELQEQKDTLAQNLQKCSAELKEKEKIETLFLAIDQAGNELQKAKDAVAVAEKNKLDAKPRKQELEDANRAMNCEKSFQQLQNIRKQQQELQKTRTELRTQLLQFEKKAEELTKKCADQKTKFTAITEQQSTAAETFKAVRQLDVQKNALLAQCSSAEKALADAKKLLEKQKKEFQEAENKWNSARKKADEAQRYCDSHGDDRELPQQKGAWELRREHIVTENQRNADEKKRLDAFRTGLSGKKQELAGNRKKLHAAEEKLKQLLAALAKSRETMDALLLGKTYQELQESRAAAMKLDELFRDSVQRREYLEFGKPCPLCGSMQHPYCEGTPVPDSGEFGSAAKALGEKIARIEKLLSEIRNAEQAKVKCETELSSLQSKITEAEAAIADDEKTEQAQTKSWEDHCRETAEKMTALTAELQNVLQLQWTDYSALPEALDNRISTFEKMNKILESLAEEKTRYEKACSVYETVNPQNEAQVQQKQQIFAECSANLAGVKQERSAKFGDKNVDAEEKKLADAVESCRRELEAAELEAIRNQEQITHSREDQQKHSSKQQELASALTQTESDFAAQLRQYEFSSPEDFSAKRRELPYIQALAAEMQKIDNDFNTGKGALAERQKMLDESLEKLPKDTVREENLQQMQLLQESSKRLQDELNESILKWKQNEDARKRFEEDGKKVASLSQAYNNWKYLDDNFGSVSADRFGRIAQGYTFSELLHYANNNRLRSLQQHFTLVNDDKEPLELNVIDHYRGDQVRTSRNLSGGEGFEVSLALALGLAEMSSISQNASLGNVLLDEGFGTLDDDALESALELLMQLRRTDHKLVGIISHVSKLKERIATQIEVTSSGGMGSLSGAGVASSHAAAKNEPPKKRAKKGRKKSDASVVAQ